MDEKELSLIQTPFSNRHSAIKFFRLLDRFGNTKSIIKASKRDLMSVDDIGPAITEKQLIIALELARGVDNQAHFTALENKSKPIAVLRNGLLVNYPPENTRLQEKISQYGAVINKYPLLKQPDRGTFLRRNKIIARFFRATLLTETALKSGALITVGFCAEYGKDVFSVPGGAYYSSAYQKKQMSLYKTVLLSC
jgi:predicted Rossmann fold nucleotide-binding protein DprA/Smf involved in DNA uptake